MNTEREHALINAREILWQKYCDCRRGNLLGGAQALLHSYYYVKCQLGTKVPLYERIHYGNEEDIKERVKASGECDFNLDERVPRYIKGKADH